jgi:NAD-dependent SIR2 family protein deacetylase
MTANALPGQIFAAHADLTQLSADAVVISTSTSLEWVGMMSGAFDQAFGVQARWERAKEGGAQLSAVGDAEWLPLDTETKPRGLVLTVCTGRAPTLTRKQKRGLPVKAAIKAAVTNLRVLGVTHRLLIGLPLMRLGKGGDSRDPLGSVRDQIAAARKVLDELAQSDLWHSGVDVVFAAFTHDHYQVVLEARRLENQQPLVKTILPPNFDLLLRSLRNDESVLFAGAGLSAETGFTDYNGLISRMAQTLGEDLSTTDQSVYLDLAQWFREQCPGETGKLVAELFGSHNTACRPSLAHYFLMSMPVRYVLTTNYDGLLERALRALRRYPICVVTDAQIAQTGRRDGTFVVKMHGDADHCKDLEDANDGIVVSRDDYDQFFSAKPMMASLLEGLLLNRTFLFVGYSLRDPNFRQIHAKIAHTLREAKQPAFTLVFESLPESARKQWNKQQVFPICIAGAAKEEKLLHLACLLDYIGEKVAGDSQLYLAQQPRPAAETSALQRKLRELGTLLEAEVEETPNDEQARRSAMVLAFLTDQGWRPRHVSLSQLWERLADASTASEDRHKRLIRALAHAEESDVIIRLRARLVSLEA